MPAPMPTVIKPRSLLKMTAFLKAMARAMIFGRMFPVIPAVTNRMRPVFKMAFSAMPGVGKFVMSAGFFMMVPFLVIRTGIITVKGVITGK